MQTTEFLVETPVGSVLLKTPDIEIARAFRKDRMAKVKGLVLTIWAEETTVSRRRVSATPLRLVEKVA